MLIYDGSFDPGCLESGNWQYDDQLTTLNPDGASASDVQIDRLLDIAMPTSKISTVSVPSEGMDAVAFADGPTAEPEPDEDPPLVVTGRTRGGSGFLNSRMIGGGYGHGYGDLNFGSISADTPSGVTDTVIQVIGLRGTTGRGQNGVIVVTADISPEFVRGRNYCGSGATLEVVPDWYGDLDLSYACFVHDRNYSSASTLDRSAADFQLAVDIARILVNGGISSGQATDVAFTYHVGVRVGGYWAYQGQGSAW